jgi:D-alanine-D-alanine ligase
MGHLSRTDFILDENDKLFILEINSMPGFTETSLFPQAAAEIGITFEKLVEHLLNLGLKQI